MTMQPDQFDDLAKLLRLRTGSTRRELARLVLVDGLSNAEAAARLGATPQQVYQAVRSARSGLELARRAVGWWPTRPSA